MKQIEEKIKELLTERENLLNEMTDIQNALNVRQQRVIEIVGSIKTLEELLNASADDTSSEDTEVTAEN